MTATTKLAFATGLGVAVQVAMGAALATIAHRDPEHVGPEHLGMGHLGPEFAHQPLAAQRRS